MDDATIKTALERRVDHSNQLVMAKLRHIVSKEALYLATTHVIWADLKLVDVQTIQVRVYKLNFDIYIFKLYFRQITTIGPILAVWLHFCQRDYLESNEAFIAINNFSF